MHYISTMFGGDSSHATNHPTCASAKSGMGDRGVGNKYTSIKQNVFRQQ